MSNTIRHSVPRTENEPNVRFSSMSTPVLVSNLMLVFVPAMIYAFIFGVEIWSTECQKVITACVSCLFLSHFGPKYYEDNVVETVKITCQKNKQNLSILKVVESALSEYRPTFWGLSGHMQSVMFAYWPLNIVFQVGKNSALSFDRQTLTMSDGGVVELDWAQCPDFLTSEEMNHPQAPGTATAASCSSEDLNVLQDKKPIMLILPGVVGKSANAYVHRMGLHAQRAGYRVCTKGYRGIDAPMPLFRPETWGPRSLEDLDETLKVIHQRYPNAPIVGVGFSFGGLCLQSYAGSPFHSETRLLRGAVSLSGCFDPEFIYEEGVLKNKLMPYDLGLTLSIVNDMKRHFPVIDKELGTDIGSKLNYSRSMEEYHTHITVPAMGLKSTKEYWITMGNFHRELMKNIDVPVLSLLAEDDPLIPPIVADRAVESITQSDGAILIQTKRGGHSGFFEGSTGQCYADRVGLDFLDAVLQK